MNTPMGFVSAILFDVHTKTSAETRNEKPVAQAEFAFISNDEHASVDGPVIFESLSAKLEKDGLI